MLTQEDHITSRVVDDTRLGLQYKILSFRTIILQQSLDSSTKFALTATNMFSYIIFIIFLAYLAILAAATTTITVTVRVQSNTGSLQCCNAVERVINILLGGYTRADSLSLPV